MKTPYPSSPKLETQNSSSNPLFLISLIQQFCQFYLGLLRVTVSTINCLISGLYHFSWIMCTSLFTGLPHQPFLFIAFFPLLGLGELKYTEDVSLGVLAKSCLVVLPISSQKGSQQCSAQGPSPETLCGLMMSPRKS